MDRWLQWFPGSDAPSHQWSFPEGCAESSSPHIIVQDAPAV